ncbi:hypothetical protein FGL97_07780 [Pseudomonas putida]|nr:hypothetical protein [Pseudomonas putida]NVN68128.1 hypothetical protein [Pseudomonas putida]
MWERPCVAKGLHSSPGGFSVDANNAGAASRPFRDTRPLPQAGVQPQPSAVSRNIITANPPINPG